MSKSYLDLLQMNEELISIREFARRVKVSDQSIRNMVRDGRLPELIFVGEGRNKKVRYEFAREEYQKAGGASKSLDYLGSARSNRLGGAGGAAGTGSSILGDVNALSGTSLKEAEIKMRLLKSEQAYRQKAGELVEIASVYAKLFEFGKELREAAQAIPAQVVADLVAANGDAHKMRTVLDVAIHSLLERMADIENRKI